MRARRVLRDCYSHLNALKHARNEHDLRRFWVALVVDARRVGHVLHKKDALHRRFIGEVLPAFYRRWKSDEPLFRLLDEERNTLLKEGKSSLLFGEWNDFKRVLALGEFVEVHCLGRRIVEWWELELASLEEQAEEVRRAERQRTKR